MWKKALSLLDEMQARDIAPTEVTYRYDPAV
jgi:pentatricopeptide repeat protein